MKRFYFLCILVLSIVLTACTVEKNDVPEVEPSVTMEPTKIVDVTPTVALNEKTVTPVPMIVPATEVPETEVLATVAPVIVQEIKYKIEENALVFYGSGVLLQYIVDECVYELAEDFQNIDKIIIEDGITQIGEYAFVNNAFTCIKTINIAGSVKIIGSMAFMNCYNIETLKIEEGVEFIGCGAFLGCEHLENVTIPQSVEVISRFAFLNTKWLEEEIEKEEVVTVNGIVVCVSNESNVIDILPNIAYASRSLLDESPWLNNQKNEEGMVIVSETLVACDNLSGDIIVPDGVKYIAEMAFSGCTGIQSVKLPQSVEFIGGYAFENCTGLITVEMYDNVKYIAESAFEGCSSLRNIELPRNLQCLGRCAFYDCTSIVDVSIPQSIIYLADCTYYGCTSLESVKMSKKLICIENDVFYSCENLDKISIPESVEAIASHAFDETKWFNEQLKNNDVVLVNNMVVGASKNAEEITIPDGVEEIAFGAFRECQLVSISIPDTVKKIGGWAFCDCSNLQTITLPDGLKHFGSGVFYGCSNLVSIAIPKNVNIMGSDVFYDCGRITIYCDSDSMAKQYAIENSLKYIEVDEQFWVNGAPMPVSMPSLQEKIENRGGTIELEGEMYNAVWGENGALAWKYVEATFDEASHIVTTFIAEESLGANMFIWDSTQNIYRTGWTRWFDLVNWSFTFNSIGEDMFSVYLVDESREAVFINGRENTYFTLSSMGLPYDYPENDKYSRYDIHRKNKFCSGYAIMEVWYKDYLWEWGYPGSSIEEMYVWVDTYGNCTYIDIEGLDVEPEGHFNHNGNWYSYNHEMGPYSDGVFYYAGSFYDFELKKVLDLCDSGYRPYTGGDIYSPQFIDGICRMVAYKNGEFWVFDIDKSGAIVSEPEMIDILWLSY